MSDHKSLCEAALQRHLDAFINADIPAIMDDYHNDATFQLQHTTLSGTAEIKELFTGFFKVKPSGSKVTLERKETIISAGIGISYISYSMKSEHIDFPLATDTFIHGQDGKFTHQTFAGYNVHTAPENKPATPSSAALKIGWIGLGQMGKAHVSVLMEKGYKNILVWNRSASATSEFVTLGAVAAKCPKEVVEQCDVTFVMLSTAAAAREVYSKPNGILEGLSKGKSIVECASIDSECMKELQKWVTDKGGRFMAMPVVGHSGMARNATCQVICAGEKSVYNDIGYLLEALAKANLWLDNGVEAASNLKLIINGLLASITASVAQAITISDKCSIDRDGLKHVLSNHTCNSPLVQFCLKMMYDDTHDPLFQLQHIRKDANLCYELAESKESESKLIKMVAELYADALSQGLGEKNWTAIHTSLSSNIKD